MTAQPANSRVGAVMTAGMLAVAFGASLGFLPGYFVADVQDDLGISRTQVGLLVSLHFGFTGLGSVLGARITEWVGVRASVVADQLMVAVAAWGSALFDSYPALLAAAMFAGFGYSLSTASTNKAVADVVPAHRLAVALSAKTAGVPIMALVASAIVPWASERWSWNATVMATGTLALLSAVVAVIALPGREESGRSSVRPEGVSLARRGRGQSPGELVPRGFWWFSVAAFFLVGSSQPLFSWIVRYLDESVGLAKTTAGGIASAAAGIGAVTMVLGALRADRIGPTRRVPFIIGLTVAMALSMAVIPLGFALDVAVVGAAAVGVIVGIATQLVAVGSMHAAVVDRAPHAVQRATGITMTGYYLGALAGPVGFGALVDWLDTYTWAWLAMAAGGATGALVFIRANRVGDVVP